MKNRIYKILSICLIFTFVLYLAGCKSNSTDYSNYATVIYHLEGGTYQGSQQDVKVYYKVKEGETLSVGKTLDNIDKNEITPNGTNLELKGWYLKDSDGNKKEDFTSSNKIGYQETIDVYAKWGSIVKYTWSFKAKINGEEIELATYPYGEANVALNFTSDTLTSIKDSLLENNCTYNYSFTYNNQEYTEDTLSELVMPEANEDHTETIYVDYISGRYKMVSSEKELTNALSSNFIYQTTDDNKVIYYDGIYLRNDIDSENSIALYNLVNGDNTHTIKLVGNNHTIKYSFGTNTSADISLDNVKSKLGGIFGNISYLDIENVNFDVTCKARVSNSVMVGFAYSANNCTIKNVSVKFTYTASNTAKKTMVEPDDLTTYEGIYDTIDSKNNTIDNFKITMTKGE